MRSNVCDHVRLYFLHINIDTWNDGYL